MKLPTAELPSVGSRHALLDERLALASSVCDDGMSQGSRGAIDLVALCRLLEAVVLHDRVTLWAYKSFETTIRSKSLLQPLISAGAIEVRYYESEDIDAALRAPSAAAPMQLMVLQSVTQMGLAARLNAGYIAGTVAPSAAAASMATAAAKQILSAGESASREDLEELDYLVGVVRVAASLPISRGDLLGASYAEFTDGLKDNLGQLSDLGRPVTVFVPPIAAIIMSEARAPEYLGEVALSLKERLEEHREKFRAYERVIQDDSASIHDARAAAERLRSGMATLTKDIRAREVVSLSEWKDAGEVMRALLGGAIGSDLAGLWRLALGAPLKLLSHHLQSKDVSYLTELNDRFRNIVGYTGNVERLFGVKFSGADFTEAIEHINGIARWLPEHEPDRS